MSDKKAERKASLEDDSGDTLVVESASSYGVNITIPDPWGDDSSFDWCCSHGPTVERLIKELKKGLKHCVR